MGDHGSDARVRTTCCYCGVGCGIVAGRDRAGRLTVAGDESHPVNRGALCSKGRSLHHVVTASGERLPRPLLGRGTRRVAASWDAALDHLAARFREAIDRHGPESVAIYCSGQMLTEEYYLANKLMKGAIGANNIDTNSRLCMSSAVMGYKLALGSDAPPISYADCDLADSFLVMGANPAWCHPIIYRRIERRLAAGAAMVVVDPRRTATAEQATVHLAPRPGTDGALLAAWTRLLIEDGKVDRAFVAERTSGYAELAAAVAGWTPERAAAVCDLDPDAIRAAAALLFASRRTLSLWTMGLNQQAAGTALNLGLINLHLLTGQIGRPGCGPFSLTGQPNAMGGREVGGMATLLAAHRDLADPDQRALVARHWGVERISPEPGLTAVELVDAIADGRIRALWIIATNPLTSLPDSERVERALAACPFVAVSDCYPTECTDLAHLVLPAATWLEKRGTMTNSERRIALLEPLVAPPGEALPDTEILIRAARRMGYGRLFPYTEVEQVFAEHAALTAGTDCDIAGLDYAVLRRERSVQWPWRGGRGRERLYTDGRFAFADGRARLHPVAHDAGHLEPRDADFPLELTTARLRDQWHTMTKTGRVARLNRTQDRPLLEIHPLDAEPRGIAGGTVVEIRSRRGSVRCRARVTDAIRPGVVCLPMHWGKRLAGALGRANNCTQARLDPRSKQPALKQAAVQVVRHVPPRRVVRIVGGGAAALALCEQLRNEGSRDELHVHAEEAEGIYDRVLLPHYIDGSLEWERLLSADAARLEAELDVRLHPGRRIVRIERDARRIVDDAGNSHAYDQLVLATGSRPAVHYRGPRPRSGVAVLRRRTDADAILAAVEAGTPVLIVGGGLLGLELADALRLRGAAVTVLQRGGRLMGKQLDDPAGELLAAELRARGIAIRFGVEVATLHGEDRLEAATLVGGERLAAGLLVFATGTEPNAELARAADLAVGRGVACDPHCRSSDPAIAAIGEVAEFEGRLYGTTPCAREQAAALARFLVGDEHAPYRGSIPANVLKLHGYQLASAGRVHEEPGDEVVRIDDPSRGLYHKAVVRHDRLVGVLMVGDTATFAEHRELIERGLELEERRAGLLRGDAPPPVRGELVCSCNQVGADTIRDCIAAGTVELDQLCRASRAGTGCGSCRGEVQRLLARQAVEAP